MEKSTLIGAVLFAHFEYSTGVTTTDPKRTFSMPDGKLVKTVKDVEKWIIDTADEIKRIRAADHPSGCVVCGCRISLKGYCAGCQTRINEIAGTDENIF